MKPIDAKDMEAGQFIIHTFDNHKFYNFKISHGELFLVFRDNKANEIGSLKHVVMKNYVWIYK